MYNEDVKVEETEKVEEQGIEVELPEEPSTEAASVQETEEQQIVSEEEQELSNYSKNVQKRIKKLTEKYRQEERDREEAVRLSKHLREENEKLKAQMQNSQKAHLTEYGSRIENQLDLAKQAYKDAHECGDADQLVEAQEQSSSQSQTVSQEQPAPTPDPRAQDWATKNEWFGQDEVMTYAAFGIHRKLVEEEGFDPTSDEYYNEIDDRIRSEFPHKFNGQKTGRSGQVASADTSASRKKSSGRRTVKLEPSEIQMARRLNVPLEEYAKYVKR